MQGHVEAPLVGPLANVLVQLQGTLTATAADGTFRVEDVAVPYTVTIGVDGSEAWVHAFEGLTTPAPVLVPRVATAAVFYTVLRGDVMGGGPLAADEMVLVCVEGVDVGLAGRLPGAHELSADDADEPGGGRAQRRADRTDG